MFVVEVGSVITTATFFIDLIGGGGQALWFTGDIAVWLWLTVIFANFAEAIAEGRGKAQADTLRAMRTTAMASRRRDDGSSSRYRLRSSSVATSSCRSRRGDPRRRRRDRGHRLGGRVGHHGRVRTGHPRVGRRPLGSHRRHAAALRPAGDQVTQEPGKSFLDRMISLVEGAERRKTPNEIALNILLAGLTVIFLVAVVTLQPFALYANSPSRNRPHLPAGRPDPDHDRRPPLLHRDRRDGPAGAPQRARALRPGSRGVRRHRRAPARQDRHHHARQPPGGRVHPGAGVEPRDLAEAAQLSSLADETPEGRSIVVLAKEFGVREHEL